MKESEVINEFERLSSLMYQSGIGKDVVKHNQAIKKLNRLCMQMSHDDKELVYPKLLLSNNEKTRINAASYCLLENMMMTEAVFELRKALEESKNEQCRVTAGVAIRLWESHHLKQKAYLQYQGDDSNDNLI